MFRVLALALILTWLAASAASDVRAQMMDATPSATDPAACSVAPRSLDELRQLVEESTRSGQAPGELTPVAMTDLPPGEPANIATIAAITATTEQVMVCINAGDVLRLLTLFSDDFVRTFAVELDLISEETTDLATPRPLDEDEWVTLGEVTNARVLPDGRIGAVISPAPPNDDEPAFFIFVQKDGRWLVDSFVDIDDDPDDGPCCAEPTPAPPATAAP